MVKRCVKTPVSSVSTTPLEWCPPKAYTGVAATRALSLARMRDASPAEERRRLPSRPRSRSPRRR